MTWISVADSLPPEVSDGESDVVLVWPRAIEGDVYQRTGLYSYRKSRQCWLTEGDLWPSLFKPAVTHWMKLPAGPDSEPFGANPSELPA